MTEAEKARFVELMKNHIGIIESKKHDVMALESKNKAWRKIYVEYNAEAQQKRSENQLRILWKDLKAKAKKVKAKQNRMKFKTGGGPPPDRIDCLSEMVIDIIPQIFTGIKEVKDDDDDEDFDDNMVDEKNDIETQVNSGEKAQKDVIIFHENRELETNVEHSPLKNVPGSSYIKEKGKSRKQNQSTDVGDKVLDFHSLKMKLMQEEYNAKMLLIDRQKEIMEEEHNFRMEILRKWKESAENCQNFSHSSHKTSDINLNNFVDMGNIFYGNNPFNNCK